MNITNNKNNDQEQSSNDNKLLIITTQPPSPPPAIAILDDGDDDKTDDDDRQIDKSLLIVNDHHSHDNSVIYRNNSTATTTATPNTPTAANVTQPTTTLKTNRTNSINMRRFTDRFRSISNEILRSFELAHDIADLHNSKFATATIQAAAQAAQQHQQSLIIPELASDDIDEANNETISSFAGRIESNVDEQYRPIQPTVPLKRDISMKQMKQEQHQQQQQPSSSSTNQISYEDECKKLINNRETRASIDLPSLHHHLKLPDTISHTLTTDTQTTCHNSYQNGLDTVDFKHSKDSNEGIYISIWEVFIYLWGCIAFFIDIVSDIILSIGYYNNNRKWLCALTLMFVIVPNVTLSLFSLSWYIDTYYNIKNRTIKQQHQKQQPNGSTNASTVNLEDENQNENEAMKHKHLEISRNSYQTSTFDSITFWITTIIFLVLQLDLVYKYIQGFIYTLKGWIYRTFFDNKMWENYYIEKQIKCDTDIGMLRLIDVFMDSGPQVLLQLYVITTQNLSSNDETDDAQALAVLTNGQFKLSTWTDVLNKENRIVLKQVISIVSSLFSMGYALAGYHRCLRNQQYIFCLNKHKVLPKPISWWSTIMQFLWYLFLITPRVLSMALFASTFRSWFFMIIFIHWLIMYFWILNLKTTYCITSRDEYNAREEIFEKFYNFVCSFIYIFVYFNLKSGNTRYRYLVYYIIFYIENCLFSISYYCFSHEENMNFKLSVLIIIIVGFWVAILFQIFYYLYFHPSQDISICVKKQNRFYLVHKRPLNQQSSRRRTSLIGNNSLHQNHTQQQHQPQPYLRKPSVASSSVSYFDAFKPRLMKQSTSFLANRSLNKCNSSQKIVKTRVNQTPQIVVSKPIKYNTRKHISRSDTKLVASSLKTSNFVKMKRYSSLNSLKNVSNVSLLLESAIETSTASAVSSYHSLKYNNDSSYESCMSLKNYTKNNQFRYNPLVMPYNLNGYTKYNGSSSGGSNSINTLATITNHQNDTNNLYNLLTHGKLVKIKESTL